ncbi:IS5 family transposase [Polycladomyces subterraneus]|uniref:IS5 family transposase n=1 Tax=Polycladomyces subterraneus TaxID=1016997 RepID=A0ABT8IS78_9BACL|nr:IS5 family transposase [Polycladomyces subterraneus]MDN4595232.1 IS5 family transposase [Polycladomyces subterraneus]
MARRGELTYQAWEKIAPLLPNNNRPGKPWKDHRTVINSILWKLRTGAPWRDLPERYGPWKTCYDRFVRWRKDGTWERLLAHEQTHSDAVSDVEWVVSVDTTIVRAHQHTAGAKRAGADRKKGNQYFQNEALGKSRGGLTTKIHLACDGKGRPLAVLLTPGQRHDSTQLETLLEAIRVPRQGRGRPRKRPDRLIADRGYSYPGCRRLLKRRGIAHTIPERIDQRMRRSQLPGRPLSFDQELYARRNVVERCINRLKQWRGIATRYEKKAVNFHAVLLIACLMIWLNS